MQINIMKEAPMRHIRLNYLIKELEIVTEPGISGNIGLTEV